MTSQKIKTLLWFESQAVQAAELYTSLFSDSGIDHVTYYPADGPGPAGGVMTVEFHLAGVHYVGLNGGPHFKFTEAISLAVDCESQAEVDRLWETLTAEGGSASQCGWLKDRFGLSWQITPKRLIELLSSPDPQVAQRVMQAMLGMSKIEIAELEKAAAGPS